MVHKLYDLTYDEVLIVDSETPITREEYNKSKFMSDYLVLNNRNIIDVLIGDTILLNFEESKLGLPYMSGPDLCSLCTLFGYPQTYFWGSGGLSRWMYMQNLIKFLDKTDRIPALLSYLFKFERFEDSLKFINEPNRIKDVYEQIVNNALSSINSSLLFSQKELKKNGNKFVLTELGETQFIETPKIEEVTLSYVRELPNRIKTDFETANYDSVVTKSRTLLEEVLIHIIEDSSQQTYNYKGNLITLYNECKRILGMQAQKDWDNRVNELLSGIEKIINSIASMRNQSSDAHGTGQRRIAIKEREARLIANASIMLSEYVLDVYNSKK